MIIYKITNKINGKIYIGQTRQTLKARMKAHFSSNMNNNNTYIKRAINKYGKDNFLIIELCSYNSLEQLNDAEEYFIEFYNCLAPNGYNLHGGGNSHLVSDVTRLKQSISHLGKSYKRTKGSIPWNKGKKGLPNNGGFAKGHIGYGHRHQKVQCSNGIIYNSIGEAARALNTSSGKICAVLKGTRNHTKGFTFKRIENASS